MKHLFLKLIIFLSLVFFNINGQDVVFEHLSQYEDICQDGIFDIEQDDNGFLWLATHKGVVRFDGINTLAFNHYFDGDDLIPFNTVSFLFVDKNNDIIAITSDGICKYSQKKNVFFKIPLKGVSYYSHFGATFTATKDVLITSSSGVLCLSENNTIKEVIIEDQDFFPFSKTIKSLFHIGDSRYFVIPPNGGVALARYDSERNSLQITSFAFKDSWCHVVAAESDSIFWLGFQSGVKRVTIDELGNIVELDSSYLIVPNLNSKSIRDIVVSSNANVYIATNGSGLFEIDNAKQSIKRYYQSDGKNSLKWDNLQCMVEDNTGVIWLGNGQGGVTKFDTKRKPFHTIKIDASNNNHLANNFTNPICIDSKGYLWAGALQGQLNRSTQRITETHASEMQFKTISPQRTMRYSLCEIANYMLIGAGSKFLFYNQDKGQLQSLPKNHKLHKIIGDNQIFVLEKDVYNRLWIGCTRGLFCVDYNNDINNLYHGDFTSLPLKTSDNLALDQKVNQIISSDSSTYMAMNNGFYISSEQNDSIVLNHYGFEPKNKRSLSHSRVTSIAKDELNQIWVGTYNGGLNKVVFNEGGELEFVNNNNGINLPVSSVLSIEAEGGNHLWLTSQNSIYKYNTIENTYVQYTLPAASHTAFNTNGSTKAPDGELFFAGNDGIVAFYPDDIKINEIPAKAAFTGLKIFNNDVEVGEPVLGRIILSQSIATLDEITLPYKCNTFSLEFAALHFSSPEKNMFKYMMDGVDEKWVYAPAKLNTANYTHVPPGEYTFLLTALNSDKVENVDYKKLMIKVLPPWYATLLARIAFVLAFAFLLVLIYKYLMKMSRLEHSLKLESMAKQKDQEVFDTKQRFFTNISHELKTPLSLIIAPIERLVKESEGKVKKDTSLVLRNALRLQRLINQILDFRRLEHEKMSVNVQKADVIALIQDVLISFEQEFKDTGLQVSFKTVTPSFEMWFDYDKIEKVLYNLISNACKYSQRGGELVLEALVDNEKQLFKFILFNEGKGIPVADKSKIFERFFQLDDTSSGAGIGLSMAKDFVEMHNGNIYENGTYDSCAQFIFTLPLKSINSKALENKKVSAKSPEENVLKLNFDKRQTILIVEDNRDMLEFVSSIFAYDYKVVTAIDGVEGYEKAKDQIPDIIITDVMMPRMDGNELCLKIKMDAKTCHIPVIMLTAKDTLDEKIEGISIGADAYVTKPFRSDYVMARAANLLESRKQLQAVYKEKYSYVSDDTQTTSADEKLLKKFVQFVDANVSNSELKVEDVAQELAYSYMQFNRKIKALTGESVGQFISQYRLQRAKQIFEKNPNIRVSEVMTSIGFSTHSHFSKSFKDKFGLSPKDFRGQLLKPKN